jgi:ATP-binding cassette subfamily B protein RaxB
MATGAIAFAAELELIRPLTPLLRFWSRRRVEPVLQTEVAECGLACMAMVAGYWGQYWTLSALRRRFGISRRGVSLRTLVDLAESLGLQSRPLKLPLEQLHALRRPAVLHWDLNHFVVLCACGTRHITVADPAVGLRRLTLSEASRHFTGIALELLPGATFSTQSPPPRIRMRSLLGPVHGLHRTLLVLLALSLCFQICVVLAPFYVQWVVDEALVSGERSLVTVLAMGAMLLVVLQAGVAAVRSWTGTALVAALGFQGQGRVFQHLLQLPLAYFERRQLGDIVSRFGAVQSLQRALTTQSVESVIDGLLAATTLGLMLAYSLPLAGLAVLSVCAYSLLRAGLLPAQREANAGQIVHAARAQTHLIESVRGVQTVRLHDRAAERRNGWLTHLARQINAELDASRLQLLSQSGNQVLFGLERAAIVWAGALAVLDSKLTVGMLFAFLSYKDQFTQRVAALVDRLCEWRVLRLHAERVADIIHQEPEIGSNQATETIGDIDPQAAIRGDIELLNVGFRHGDGEPLVLDGLNLRIAAGQSLVITGPSGCGKTTLLKLLLGLHQPTVGEIRYAGKPLSQLGLGALRAVVGSVMQDDHLFSGSVIDNISFFDPEPDMPRILHCARLAIIHDDIIAMPMHYQTLIGENGSSLSGGQRQRLLLARALYRQPRVLVLDEASSHLDAAAERRINASLKNLDITRIVIAHRAETIASAQRVVIMESGRVVSDRRTGSDPVDEHEQAEPHHVDEVPVPGHRLKREMTLRREMTTQAAQPDHGQHDGTESHVEAVEAGQHEES